MPPPLAPRRASGAPEVPRFRRAYKLGTLIKVTRVVGSGAVRPTGPNLTSRPRRIMTRRQSVVSTCVPTSLLLWPSGIRWPGLAMALLTAGLQMGNRCSCVSSLTASCSTPRSTTRRAFPAEPGRRRVPGPDHRVDLISVFKDYRQRVLNSKICCRSGVRCSPHAHLPLPKLWEIEDGRHPLASDRPTSIPPPACCNWRIVSQPHRSSG